VSTFVTERTRAVLVLVVAVLPWVAGAPKGDPSFVTHPAAPSSVAIESVTSLLVIATDRPALASHSKRIDGMRWTSTTPPGGLGVHPASLLAWEMWRSDSIGLTGPIAFHFASRGPPPLAAS
jgi:hypothetical protein